MLKEIGKKKTKLENGSYKGMDLNWTWVKKQE